MADIYYNATVLTQDQRMPRAEAFAVVEGRITAVGTDEGVGNLAASPRRRVNLGGRVVIPGFNDAHVHTWKVGQMLTSMMDARATRSIEELLNSISVFAAPLPEGRCFQGRGYNEALLREQRHPTRHDLDRVLPNRPGFVIRTCGHIWVANSMALHLAGITASTPNPPDGHIERDERGEPNGILHECAIGLVMNLIPAPTRAEYEEMILAGCRHQLHLGITSATDPAVLPDLLEAYRSLDANHALPQRMNLLATRRPSGSSETFSLPEMHVSEFLRTDSVKFFADGGLSGGTAALRVPYKHATTNGILRFTADELYSLALEPHSKGYRIGVHAIGDVAIETVLDVYTRLAAEAPGRRHRIEHFGVPDGSQVRRMVEGRFIAVPQPIFLEEFGVNYRKHAPDDYLLRAYPLRTMLDAGITMAISSNAPVVHDDNPLRGIRAAVLRRDTEGNTIAPEEGLTIEEALRLYTLGGAIASGDENNRGSITAGKWADFAVLDKNPLETDPESLLDIQVEQVFVAGNEM